MVFIYNCKMLRWKFFRYKSVALGWLVLMCILFFLPGSAFPQENWLDQIHFDKWVHVGLFAVLLFLWRSSFDWSANYYVILLLFCALAYGLAVEFIQKSWVANRSFDLFDVLFDMIGSALGLFVWSRVYKKNKPL
jgi:VanZ family protein